MAICNYRTAFNALYLQMKVQVLLTILLIGSMIEEQDAFITDLVVRTTGHLVRHFPARGRRRRRRRRWTGDEGRHTPLYSSAIGCDVDPSPFMGMQLGRQNIEIVIQANYLEAIPGFSMYVHSNHPKLSISNV